MTDQGEDWTPQYCEDAVFVPASPEHVFDVLRDIAGWNDWWVAMRFEPQQDGPLKVGDRVVFDGAVIRWMVAVEAIEPPRSIRFRYIEGALVGETEWRVTAADGGCTAAYIYHGVVAGEERAATTFGRFGTALHTMVMRRDALDGLVRKVTGQPLDEAWREGVRAAIGDGRAVLVAESARA